MQQYLIEQCFTKISSELIRRSTIPIFKQHCTGDYIVFYNNRTMMKPLLTAIRKNSICAWDCDFGSQPYSPFRKPRNSVVKSKEQNIPKLDLNPAPVKLPLQPTNKIHQPHHFPKEKRIKTHCFDHMNKQKSKESNMTLPPAVDIELTESFFIWDKPDPLSIWGFRALSPSTNAQRSNKHQQLQSTRSHSRAWQSKKVERRHHKTSSFSIAESTYFDPVEAVKRLVSYKSSRKRKSLCLSFNQTFDSANQTKYIKRSWKNRIKINTSVLDE